MPHPLVDQLRFARSEFVRCLDGVSEDDACRHLGPMNCISWIVGHLANQEQFLWVILGQDRIVSPGLNDRVGHGMPASTPPLAEMWDVWHGVTQAADPFLDTLTSQRLQEHYVWQGRTLPESIGTLLLRNTYHYWFHTGEAHAIRQQLGHPDLPQFVGDMSPAVYRPA